MAWLGPELERLGRERSLISMNGDKRLIVNPFAGIGLLDPKSDRRRIARPLTEEEMRRLIATARDRPLIDALTIRRKTAILTGLRLREIRTLTAGDLNLEHQPACLTLATENEKNREGSQVAIRSDLAADLRAWLTDRLNEVRREALAAGEEVPDRVPAALPVFYVPDKLVRILDRDLKLAGIRKVDASGRRVHVHGLRHTFGTHLSKTGASPRTAQAAMRHSNIGLTMNVYTDPKLLDVSGAVERLPSLPLDLIVEESETETLAATGTDGGTRSERLRSDSEPWTEI